MVVGSILGLFSYNKLRSAQDEDWVDRLNHVYTTILLIAFAFLVTGGLYVGMPIECLKPHGTDIEMGYVNSFCWIRNTYYVPMEEGGFPTSEEYKDHQEISFYQWVPQILIFMALMFKLPSVVWRMFNGGTGINMDKMVSMTVDSQIGDAEKREETVSMIAKYLDRWLRAHHHYEDNAIVRFRHKMNTACCFLFSKREGTYLVGLYFVVKALYATNTIAQFFILNSLLGSWFSTVGFDSINGQFGHWNTSHIFPRVTFCDGHIRQMNQKINHFTTQCLLPINLFNEKIFIFLWYWLVLVSACTLGNLVFWLWRSLFNRNKVAYVKKYLKMMDEIRENDDKKLVKEFADDYLRDDGMFVLRIVARNTNDILLSDIIRHMWAIFKHKRQERERKESQDLDHLFNESKDLNKSKDIILV